MGMFGRTNSIELSSVKDCEKVGVMAALSERPYYQNEQQVLAVLDTIAEMRFDVTLGIHERLNACIESYRAGDLH